MSREFDREIKEQGGYALVQKLFTSEAIDQINKRLATQISSEYKRKNPVFIIILNGALPFGRDILRRVKVGPAGYDTMAISSYGNRTESSRQPIITKDISVEIKDRHVLVLEDIIDSGHSIKSVTDILKAREPSSLKICTLLDKRCKRETPVPIDYIGEEIPDKFVVGYGLDVNGLFRLLPDIWEARKIPTT